MPGKFVLGWFDGGINAERARIELFDEPLDRPALAGGIRAFARR